MTRARWAGGILFAAGLLLVLPVVLAGEGADWRFGKGMTVAKTSEGRWLRFALRNRGAKSGQPVLVYAVRAESEPDGPDADAEPVLDLSKRTKKKRSVVIDGPIELDEGLREADRIWLYLVVGGQVTDLMPIVEGEPDENAVVRRKLQRERARRRDEGGKE